MAMTQFPLQSTRAHHVRRACAPAGLTYRATDATDHAASQPGRSKTSTQGKAEAPRKKVDGTNRTLFAQPRIISTNNSGDLMGREISSIQGSHRQRCVAS